MSRIHKPSVPQGLSPRRSFSTKLSLAIMLLAAPIFIISLGVLFTQSRHIIRMEAVGRANSMLNATMQRICRNLITIETATNAYSWFIPQHLQPDTLLDISNKVVRHNPHVDGCAISTEPNVFPEYGRYFSAYTIRKKNPADGRDSITTVVEGHYEYFEKVWYKLARQQRKATWTVYFDEADSLPVTIDGMVASYSKPLFRDKHHMVGVISTDLSLLRLSKVISAEEKPYPNSFFMMLDKDGRYIIHPDSTRLFKETIFSNTDPKEHADLITLGHEMTVGNQGYMNVVIDGVPSLVCYKPVKGTSWSLALVSPDHDVLTGYYKLAHVLTPLLVIGLIVILLLCRRAVSTAINPLNTLLEKTQTIASGNMEVHIPNSPREDSVGRLQNSFATMLRTLQFHMGSVRYTTEQTQHRNEELAQATQLAQDAERQKTAFIQDVSHQIRTPLNIIMGFAQILSDVNPANGEGIPKEEIKSITDTMNHNSKLLNRMVLMLFDSSETGMSEEKQTISKHEMVPCNGVVREAINYIKLYFSDINIVLKTDLDDSFCVHTNRIYLVRSLREVLYNSAKYSDGQHVVVRIVTQTSPPTVRFIIEDKGKGIPEADRDLMFKFFTKVDDLSEGLGLGLPLAKRHALSLGGDLTLDVNYKSGCRIIIELPLA